MAKKARSCGYPMLALPRAIDAAKALCENFGEGPYPREAAAKGDNLRGMIHVPVLTYIRAKGLYGWKDNSIPW